MFLYFSRKKNILVVSHVVYFFFLFNYGYLHINEAVYANAIMVRNKKRTILF